jgi:hypothetical protein
MPIREAQRVLWFAFSDELGDLVRLHDMTLALGVDLLDNVSE